MQVFLAEHAGFCSGVKKAVNLTLHEAESGEKVKTLGQLVHNEYVSRLLKQYNVEAIETEDELEDETVIIRTHGAAPKVWDYLRKKDKVKVIDATCPFVKYVQDIAYNYSQKGYKILIYGNSSHPEVQALWGWAGDAAEIIEPGTESWKNFDPGLHTVIIAQTTQAEKDFFETAEALKEKNPGIIVFNTICRATVLRQNEAKKLAPQVDLMLVVGDKKSSNTRKLTEICREITKTYQVTGADDISDDWLVGVEKVGVTAGASTPDWKIKEVMVKMENGNLEAKAEEFSQMGEEEVKTFRPGDVVPGKVVSVEEEQVQVDIGYKSEALLPKKEVFLEGESTLQDVFSEGDDVDLLVLKINEEDDQILVSQKKLERERRWKELEDALDEGITLKGTVKEVVPAGVIINLGSGIEGFMPGSLVDIQYIPDFTQFVGQELSFKVIELNREKDKVILSRKQAQEEEQEDKKKETLESLQEGAIVSGTVKRLTDFGVFVDVGGIDGLVHISEISWQRIGHPKEVLSVGDEIQVKVLEVIPEKERISLSLRYAQDDPWSNIEEKLQVGEIVNGKVTRLVNFGAFVELLPGVEGLVHISQIADFHVKHPSEVLQENEEVQVKILEINENDKRISLSIKDAQPTPRDFSSSNQESDQEDGGVTLGDVFGDLFNKNKE